MAKAPNAVEILLKIWTAWVGRTNVTDDRQTTDRQMTKGRAIAYSHARKVAMESSTYLSWSNLPNAYSLPPCWLMLLF